MRRTLAQMVCAPVVLLAVGHAWAGPCMVMGDKSAVVLSEEGEKSPAFLTQSCEKLKLKSGKAMVSWVERDGKPQMAAIEPNGVARYPRPGNEERSAKVVWAEITTRREAPRAAVMRNLGVNEARPAVVYVPPEGLEIRPDSAAPWQLRLGRAGAADVVAIPAVEPGRFVLSRAQLQPGMDYVLEWTGGGAPIQWAWRVMPETQSHSLDENYNNLLKADLEKDQMVLLKAMWFEQLRLPLNMNLTIKGMP